MPSRKVKADEDVPTGLNKKPEAAEAAVGLPPFPENAWRGVFESYRQAMDGTTEACDAAHFATFWATIATILGRSVSMYSGDTVYPNVYLAVWGESGDKKTTAERRVSSCKLLEHSSDILVVRGLGSTEGLGDDLSASETGKYLFTWDEFSTFLAHAGWKGSTLLEFITETFDCPDIWEKNYRKNPIRLTTPTPTILTATTPAWFWKNAKAEHFFGGFGNRVFFLSGEKKPPLPNPDPIDGDKIQAIKQHLKSINGLSTHQAKWDIDAKRIWDAFYVELEGRRQDGLLGAALKRTHVYVRKLCMIYAALEQTLPYICKDQLEAAVAVGLYGAKCTERLIDMHAAQNKPMGELEEIFLKWVTAHEGDRVRRMQQLLWKYCGDSETFNRVLKNLVHADRIEIRERRVYLST